MSLNYVKHEEEFLGVAKLTNGDEVIGKFTVVKDTDGTDVVFIVDPAKVHHGSINSADGKRTEMVGLKRWMYFSDEEFFIVPDNQIISLAPQSVEATMMYKMFARQEFQHKTLADLKEQNELPPNPSQGFLGTVEDNRQKFEDLFNKPLE